MTPRFRDHVQHLTRILAAAREAVNPFDLVRAAGPSALNWGVVSLGKAAPAMDAACATPLGRRVVVTTDGTEAWGSPEHVEFVDHPLPTERNVRAAERVARFIDATRVLAEGRPGAVQETGVDPAAVGALRRTLGAGADLSELPLMVLLSGGASACLASPAEGLTLEDVRAVTAALMAAGCGIDELNVVRKHVESLKGGRLAARAYPVVIHALVLSDVVSGDVASVGSGPVSGDRATFAHARDVVRRYGVEGASPRVTAHLDAGLRGERPGTVREGDELVSRVKLEVIGSVWTAVDAACAAAAGLGMRVERVEGAVTGEASVAGRVIAGRVMTLTEEAARTGRAIAVIAGGETTVAVGAGRAGSGRGGRNQEAALAAAVTLDGHPSAAVMTFASDGVDGPTDAAGALVTGSTAVLARAHGVDLAGALAGHDSYGALGRLGALIKTGATGTNVNDLTVGVVYPP